MPQLSEEKRQAQHFWATRAICVRYTNQMPGTRPKALYDNQYVYKLRHMRGYTPQYWEAHFMAYLKRVAPLVLEASMHDVTYITDLTPENRIAQLVTNGHFLF